MKPIRSVEFVVLDEPIGYVAKAVGSKNERAKAYWGYCERVRAAAIQVGVMPPLLATVDKPITISLLCFFGRANHYDPENVAKGVKDALFYKAEGGDRFTGGAHFPPLYDKENPRAVITVEWWEMADLKKEYGLE